MDGKKIFALVLTVALAFFFIVPNGLGKAFGLMGTDVAAMAATFGYSAGFMRMIGFLELLGGVGLLIPQTRKLAAFGLVGLMLGAIMSHVRAPETLSGLPMPILTAVALLLVVKLHGLSGSAAPAA
ncbi:MAG: DoxX family protein [Longimicrobiales bacterium]